MALVETSVSAAVMIVITLLLRREKANKVKRISRTSILCVWNLILLRAILPFRIPLREIPFLKSVLVRVETVRLSEAAFNLRLAGNGAVEGNAINIWVIIRGLLVIVWLIGAVCMLIRLMKSCRDQIRIINDYDYLPLNYPFIDEMIRELGIRRRVTVHYNRYIETPLTTGVLHPRIMIPNDFQKYTQEDIKNVFLHELMHIKRFDVVMKMAWGFVRCIHWFNPLIHIAPKYYQIDQEMSCDEQVIKRISESEKRRYAQTLLRMALKNKEELCEFPTLDEDKSVLRERICAIVKYRKMGITGIAIVVLVFGCCTVSFASFEVEEQTVVVSSDGETGPILAEEETERKENEESTEENSKDKASQSNKEAEDNKINAETEIKTETETTEAETEFEKMSYEEYERVMKDIEENYNDFSQELTEEQKRAVMQRSYYFAARDYKKRLNEGERLNEKEMEILKMFGTDEDWEDFYE